MVRTHIRSKPGKESHVSDDPPSLKLRRGEAWTCRAGVIGLMGLVRFNDLFM